MSVHRSGIIGSQDQVVHVPVLAAKGTHPYVHDQMDSIAHLVTLQSLQLVHILPKTKSRMGIKEDEVLSFGDIPSMQLKNGCPTLHRTSPCM